MARILRWFGFHVHEWDKWSEVKIVECEDRTYGEDLESWTEYRQSRECKTCGLCQFRRVK